MPALQKPNCKFLARKPQVSRRRHLMTARARPGRPGRPEVQNQQQSQVAVPRDGKLSSFGLNRGTAGDLLAVYLVSTTEQVARDDQALNFAGAFVDREDTGVAVHALDVAFARIAHAAVNLDGLVGDAIGRLGGEKFRARRKSSLAD